MIQCLLETIVFSISDNSSQPIWINNFPCVSRQPCIGNCIGCSSTSLLSPECDHSNDVTIECRKLTNIVFDNTLTVVLYSISWTQILQIATLKQLMKPVNFHKVNQLMSAYTLKQLMKPINVTK